MTTQTYRSYTVDLPGTAIDLRLDRNESMAAFASFDQSVDELRETMRQYPSLDALREVLAARNQVSIDRVLVTAGGDDALMRACLAFLNSQRGLLTTTPTFEMLPRYCQLAGARWIQVPHASGSYPIDNILQQISSAIGVIGVVTPNNPTGTVVSPESLVRLSDAASDAVVLVDLAYAEYADVDLTDVVKSLANAVQVRTLSKAWGLAGLRIGYAIGPPELLEPMSRLFSPYPVSGVSAALAIARLKSGDAVLQSSVAMVQRQRELLHQQLVAAGIDAVESQANFVFAYADRAESIWRELGKQGIAVRYFPRAPEKPALRITCPGIAEPFDRLMSALKSIV